MKGATLRVFVANNTTLFDFLKMTTARAQVVETSVTEQQQSYSGLRSPGRSTYFKMTPGFKTFPVLMIFVDMVIFTSFSYI